MREPPRQLPGPGPAAVPRRDFLIGAGAAAAAALLAGCAPSGRLASPGSSGGAAPSGVGGASAEPTTAALVTLGSNQSDPIPKAALQQVVDAFTAATGVGVSVNTVDHAAFQNQLSNYLQGKPDDVFTWFAGYRMRFFADQDVVGDVSDVWTELRAHYGEGVRSASSALDGRQFFVPFYTYPWVLLYRRSLWDRMGYEPPETWADLLDLLNRMDSDGLVPIAFGDRDGWPAMGFFDILDLRLNGYDFHLALLDGRESWRDDRVRHVFERWRKLLPYVQRAALGRTWQEAAQTAFTEDAGMVFAGTFAAEQATPEQRADLELLPFPLLGTDFDGERAIDAPINGFMLSRDPVDRDAAIAFLRFVASGPAQEIWSEANPTNVAAAADADASHYTALQRRAAEILGDARRLAQFFDRDTRPDFSGPAGMQAFLQDFLAEPDRDLDAYLASIQAYWDSLA
jgi:multiple sugar transport system substrate-binding protein